MTSLLALALIVSTASPEATHRQTIELLNQGQYPQAAVLSQTALHQYETRYGASSLEAALMLRDLAKAWRGAGYLVKAEAAERREIEILRERVGEDDANLALAIDMLGEILFDQGHFTEAGRAFKQALHIAEKMLDPWNPHLATILNDLGAVYYRDGRPAEAARLLHRALAIREASDQPHVAITRANLAAIERTVASRK